MESMELVRAKITLDDSAARSEVVEYGAKTDGTPFKVGYIDLPSFYMDMEAAHLIKAGDVEIDDGSGSITLENIGACSLIVLLHKGHLVYYGPPNDAQAYFGISRLSDVYELLESRTAEEWAERFKASPRSGPGTTRCMTTLRCCLGRAGRATAPPP